MYRIYVRNKNERRWYELNCRGLPCLARMQEPPFTTRDAAVDALSNYTHDVTSPLQTIFDFKQNLYVTEFSVRIEKEL